MTGKLKVTPTAGTNRCKKIFGETHVVFQMRCETIKNIRTSDLHVVLTETDPNENIRMENMPISSRMSNTPNNFTVKTVAAVAIGYFKKTPDIERCRLARPMVI